jgi:glycosyltransferase involved in cell wall biosynthesis
MNTSDEQFSEKKICVLIPTYNNSRTLRKVIEDVCKYTNQIIVVDDGSTDNTADILKQFRDITVVSYQLNRGKGFAIRQGFKKANELGYRYAITIDSDGQHFPDDLPVFLKAVEIYPDSIIVGQRNMDQDSVPGRSNFGRNFSNFWYWFETGKKLQDTQSGYRLYPISRMKDINFVTNKFEFEIEVLVRCSWAGINVVEAPVKVFYPERTQRVSHFRPVRDFTRISILNTVLVTITLLYIKPRDFLRSFRGKNFWRELKVRLFSPSETDATKSLSVAFGVFMGIVPVWGFQLIIAIALSILFRLNKAIVIVAANISIPPMIPIILFASHAVGGIVMGADAVKISFDRDLNLEMLRNSLLQYFIGAILLAIFAGIIFGLATFAVLKLRRSKTVVDNA